MPAILTPFFVALVLGPAAGTVSPDERNLVPNPSLEEVDGDAPRHWLTNTWGGDARFERGLAHTGDTCVKLSSTQGADASWSVELKVQPRTDYRLSCWIKTQDLVSGSGFGAGVNLHQLQLAGKTPALSGTQDWTRVESTFHSGPHEVLLLNLLFGGWGRSTGTAWFDDVEVVDLTSPLPALSEQEGQQFYAEQVRPLLEEHCFRCHGDRGRPKGNLRFDHRAGLLRGGDSGPAFDQEHPRDSLLLQAVHYETYEMPPSGKLPAAEIELLTRWIRLGAPYSADTEALAEMSSEQGEEAEHRTPQVDETTRAHWSFVPVVRPAPPTPKDPQWARRPVDAFIAHRLEQQGLTPAPLADRQALIRRVSYDLTGLPPTPAEVQAFVQDESEDAWPQLVERLLASPHYGEKWGRHWLDLVRYAETNSFERDGKKPFVWRYRDYVIRSFNEDKPYDQFLLEQLAGDELEGVTQDGVTPETIVATGYYRLGLWDDEPADPEQARFDELDDIVMTTGQVMLGLTVNCARCHDHKLDPIPQRDYYRLLSFFRGVRRYGIRGHDTVLDRSTREIATPQQRESNIAAVAEHRRRVAALREALGKIEDIVKTDFEPVEHEEFKNPGARVDLVKKRIGGLIDETTFTAYRERTEELRRLERRPPPALARALCVNERGPNPDPTHVLIRGNPHVPGDEVQPGFPEVLGFPDPSITPPPDGKSSGRRLALARWVTSPENPLTARVMMNRLWQHHFGRGLVRTTSDFGLQGSRPTHPQLLDWLAAEFVESGWSLKEMHRRVLLSRTYRMALHHDPVAEARDPGNELWWRFDLRRLTAEEMRDSVLAVNRSLNPEMYGESIYSAIPREVLAGQSRPGEGWGRSSPEQRARRSVYIHVKRSLITPMLATFDVADVDFTCPVRFATTQPTQALTMLNSEFMAEQSKIFAEWIRQQCGPDLEAGVQRALWQTTQREPEPAEVQRGLDLIGRLQTEHGLNEDEALRRFCLIALNLNEFAYLH